MENEDLKIKYLAVATRIASNPEELVFFKKKAAPYKGVTAADIIKIYLTQDCECALCGDEIILEGQRTHVDHIVPRAKGGEDEIENFELVCSICNYAKRDTSLKDFLLMCVKIDNKFHNTDILPREEVMKIVKKRWKRENKEKSKNNA